MPVFSSISLFKILFTTALFLSSHQVFALSFAPGNIYGSYYNDTIITEYDSSGNIISTLIPSIDSGYTRGMTFGPDGLLYIVAKRPNNELFGFTVYALDESGVPQKSWTNTNAYIGGNIAHGKIAFDANGNFYVGSGAGLHKFNSANQNHDSLIFSTAAYDVDVLANGDLIIATDYEVFHTDSSGNIFTSISFFSDPFDLSSSSLDRFTNIRSIEFDTDSNTLLVYHIGHTNFFHQLMRLSPTGELLNTTTHSYALDLAMLSGNGILASSWTGASAAYDSNLLLIANAAGPIQSFFTVR